MKGVINNMAKVALGKICFLPKGTYSSATTYSFLDAVNYDGCMYVSKVDSNTNHTPGASGSSDYWMLMVNGVTNAQLDALSGLIPSNGSMESDTSVATILNGITNLDVANSDINVAYNAENVQISIKLTLNTGFFTSQYLPSFLGATFSTYNTNISGAITPKMESVFSGTLLYVVDGAVKSIPLIAILDTSLNLDVFLSNYDEDIETTSSVMYIGGCYIPA